MVKFPGSYINELESRLAVSQKLEQALAFRVKIMLASWL